MAKKEFNLRSLLSEQSLKSKDAGVEVERKRKMKVEELSVYDLVPSEDNFYSTDDITELKEAIELFGGVKQNLIVKSVENGKYKVIAGHKRRLASIALVAEGKKEFEMVPCCIEECESVVEKLLLIMTNSTARQLSDYEKMRQATELKQLLEEYKKQEKLPGRIRDLIADMLGTSSSQVARMEAISNHLSDEFKDEFKENKLNVSVAYELSGLSEEQQDEAYEQYKESGSISINEVKDMKQMVKDAVHEAIEVKRDFEEDAPVVKQVGKVLDEEYEEHEVMPGQQGFYEDVPEQIEEVKSEECCGYCGKVGTSMATDGGNYIIQLDGEHKVARVMRKDSEIEVLAFVYCPMCGRKL